MKFNHLLNQKERLQFCKNRNLVVCKWKPVSEGAGNRRQQCLRKYAM